jgi:hypothetical protein
VVPALGVNEHCDVVISATFEVLIGTLLDEISVMEASADELYDLRGDTVTLMKCANILPFVADEFKCVFARSQAISEGTGQ